MASCAAWTFDALVTFTPKLEYAGLLVQLRMLSRTSELGKQIAKLGLKLANLEEEKSAPSAKKRFALFK